MPKKPVKSRSPVSLPAHSEADKNLIQVIIETPKYSRNKYAYDPEQQVFELKKVLPSGMSFPYDFGFVPSTRAEDGDPIDVLVLMDEPVPVGCLVKSRLIGVIEGKQREKDKTKWIRNDRLIAVESNDHEHSDAHDLNDLNPRLLDEIGQFFTNYHRLEGSEFKVIRHGDAKAARKLLKKALR